MNIFMTGQSGYLGKHLINELEQYEVNIYNWDNVEDNINIDYIIHFGTPSQANDIYPDALKKELLEDVFELCHLANYKNATLIFANSEAVNTILKSDYIDIKRTSSFIIKQICNAYINLIIPRVYSNDRTKGLIKALKENSFKGDYNNKVNYITIQHFVDMVITLLQQKMTNYDYTFKTTSTTILELKKLFIDIDIDKK